MYCHLQYLFMPVHRSWEREIWVLWCLISLPMKRGYVWFVCCLCTGRWVAYCSTTNMVLIRCPRCQLQLCSILCFLKPWVSLECISSLGIVYREGFCSIYIVKVLWSLLTDLYWKDNPEVSPSSFVKLWASLKYVSGVSWPWPLTISQTLAINE